MNEPDPHDAPSTTPDRSQIPELCIEVLSGRKHTNAPPSSYVDGSRVQEHWIIDLSGIFERWHGKGLEQGEEVKGTLSTPWLPGFELDQRRLFEAR